MDPNEPIENAVNWTRLAMRAAALPPMTTTLVPPQLAPKASLAAIGRHEALGPLRDAPGLKMATSTPSRSAAAALSAGSVQPWSARSKPQCTGIMTLPPTMRWAIFACSGPKCTSARAGCRPRLHQRDIEWPKTRSDLHKLWMRAVSPL